MVPQVRERLDMVPQVRVRLVICLDMVPQVREGLVTVPQVRVRLVICLDMVPQVREGLVICLVARSDGRSGGAMYESMRAGDMVNEVLAFLCRSEWMETNDQTDAVQR